jgi:hypothetical protein
MLTRGQRITGYVRHRCGELNVFKHHIPVTTIATTTTTKRNSRVTVTSTTTTSNKIIGFE